VPHCSNKTHTMSNHVPQCSNKTHTMSNHASFSPTSIHTHPKLTVHNFSVNFCLWWKYWRQKKTHHHIDSVNSQYILFLLVSWWRKKERNVNSSVSPLSMAMSDNGHEWLSICECKVCNNLLFGVDVIMYQ
jgi:hypothetical protein